MKLTNSNDDGSRLGFMFGISWSERFAAWANAAADTGKEIAQGYHGILFRLLGEWE